MFVYIACNATFALRLPMQLSDGKLFSEMMQMISLAQSRSQAFCTECFQIIVAFHGAPYGLWNWKNRPISQPDVVKDE